MPQQRLFVSESFAVLQDAFVTAVQALKTADPLAPLTVLAPSDLFALRLRRAVAWAGPGHVGLYIFTLLDFAREIAEGTLSQEGQQPLPPLAAPLIVRKLLSETETSNYFAPLATQPGFPRSFLATIADLKHAGVQPQDLRTFIERAQLRGTYRHKVDSLHVLYDRYARFLAEQRLYDDVDLIERAVAVLEASPGTTPVFLYGFYEFTPLQRRLVAAALRERDVLVFFPWRSGPAYEHAVPACVRAPLAPLYAGPPSKAMDTLEFHLASVDQALAEGDPAPLGYLPVVAPFFSCALHAAHQRWDTPRLTAFDGMIEDESVRAVLHRHLFPAAMVLSTSALETYARCPFRYFLSAVLGLTPQEDPERVLTLQPHDRGALLHDILYDFFTRLRAAGRLPLATQ